MTCTSVDVKPNRVCKPTGEAFAVAAAVVGLGYAAISIYWGVGGTGLLDTVGGSLERAGRAGHSGVVTLLWAAVVLKVVAAMLPIMVIHRRLTAFGRRLVRGLAWTAGVALSVYGLVLTSVGLLVQLDFIAASATADH